MKFSSARVLSGLVLAVLFVLTSCITRPPEPDSEPIVIQAADLTIRLTPLGYDTLVERHGANSNRKRVNPYVDFPGQMPQRRIVVFEADIRTTESTVEMALQEIRLRIMEKGGRAASAQYLNNLWLPYRQNTPWVEKIPTTNRKYMLPREFTVTPDTPVQGYLVFAEPYPKDGGNGLLTFMVKTPQGDQGTLEEEIWFSESGAKGRETGNTGIFAEESE